MATMNISVPDQMREYVQRRVDSGRYMSASDYVRDLIRKDQAVVPQETLSVQEISESIEASRAEGESRSADEVFASVESKLKSMAVQS